MATSSAVPSGMVGLPRAAVTISILARRGVAQGPRGGWAQMPDIASRVFILAVARSGSASRPAWSESRKTSA